MSKIYKGSSARYRMARAAMAGRHFVATAACEVERYYEIGDRVILKNGQEMTVSGKTSWGDYTLEEMTGYFAPGSLRPA